MLNLSLLVAIVRLPIWLACLGWAIIALTTAGSPLASTSNFSPPVAAEVVILANVAGHQVSSSLRIESVQTSVHQFAECDADCAVGFLTTEGVVLTMRQSQDYPAEGRSAERSWWQAPSPRPPYMAA
jgi:hypothetical protein